MVPKVAYTATDEGEVVLPAERIGLYSSCVEHKLVFLCPY